VVPSASQAQLCPKLSNLLRLVRSSRGAYQKWAELTGDMAYTFENFLPYFKRSAHYHPPNQTTRLANSTTSYNESVFSPDGGPLQVGYPAWVNPISSWIARGLTALGLQQVPGLSDGDIFGFGYTAFTQDPQTQTRSSSEASYLREALRETTNLLVYKNTLAKSVLFDTEKRATGVVVNSGGVTYQINATKEVILSAGAVGQFENLIRSGILMDHSDFLQFRSPQLLMVSGIGPRETLEEFDISVLADLKGVGQNMWVSLSFQLRNLLYQKLMNRRITSHSVQHMR